MIRLRCFILIDILFIYMVYTNKYWLIFIFTILYYIHIIKMKIFMESIFSILSIGGTPSLEYR